VRVPKVHELEDLVKQARYTAHKAAEIGQPEGAHTVFVAAIVAWQCERGGILKALHPELN